MKCIIFALTSKRHRPTRPRWVRLMQDLQARLTTSQNLQELLATEQHRSPEFHHVIQLLCARSFHLTAYESQRVSAACKTPSSGTWSLKVPRELAGTSRLAPAIQSRLLASLEELPCWSPELTKPLKMINAHFHSERRTRPDTLVAKVHLVEESTILRKPNRFSKDREYLHSIL